MRSKWAVAAVAIFVSVTLLVGEATALERPAAAAPAPRLQAPPPLPSEPQSTERVQGPVGDFSNPPTPDPATGVRPGLVAKPEETPPGARLVAQSPTSDTYALADGKFLLREHGQVVNWRDESGAFRRLDLALAKGGDGRWRPRSSPFGVSLADSVSAGGSRGPGTRLAQLDGPGWSVAFDVAGAPALSLKADGGRGTYSLGGGVSLVEVPSVDGLKEAIRLEGVPVGTGDVSYTFPLDLRGVTPSVSADGTILFSTADGTAVLSVPPGAATDSAIPVAAVSPVQTALLGGPGAWALRVTTSGAWLRDPARVFPVVVDPTFVSGHGSTNVQDAFVVDVAPTTNYNGASQYSPSIGYYDAAGVYGGAFYNTLLKWNVASLSDKGIVSATMKLKVLNQSASPGSPYLVSSLGGDFAPSTVTWNTRPSTGTTTATLGTAAVGAVATANVTPIVAGWAGGSIPTHSGWGGVSVTSAGHNAWAHFGAAEAVAGNDPILEVTYADLPPATVASPLGGSCFNPDHSVTTCPATVGSTSPTITLAQAGNPAGRAVSYWYQLTDGSGVAGNLGAAVGSGWVPGLAWAPPVGSLVDGRTYSLSVWTMVDGVINNPVTQPVAVRLLDESVVPDDTVGDVTVNLATGTPSVSLGSRGFSGPGGSVGLAFDYDPQRTQAGLRGSYYNNCNGATSPWPAAAVTRVDPVITFNWGGDPVNGGPAPGLVGGNNFCAQWTGTLTVPHTGTWQVGTAAIDDGIEISIGSTVVLRNWTDHYASSEFCTGAAAACNQTLTGGVPYPITIKYFRLS